MWAKISHIRIPHEYSQWPWTSAIIPWAFGVGRVSEFVNFTSPVRIFQLHSVQSLYLCSSKKKQPKTHLTLANLALNVHGNKRFCPCAMKYALCCLLWSLAQVQGEKKSREAAKRENRIQRLPSPPCPPLLWNRICPEIQRSPLISQWAGSRKAKPDLSPDAAPTVTAVDAKQTHCNSFQSSFLHEPVQLEVPACTALSLFFKGIAKKEPEKWLLPPPYSFLMRSLSQKRQRKEGKWWVKQVQAVGICFSNHLQCVFLKQ